MPTATKPKPSQKSFNEAVKTYMDDFGMEPDEALNAAIEELELQGFDLSGILKSTEGGQIDRHAVRVYTQQLESALSTDNPDATAVTSLLESLKVLFEVDSNQTLQENLSVAEQSGSVAVLLKAVSPAVSTTSILALKVLALLLQSTTTRQQMAEHGGVAQVVGFIKEHGSSDDLQAAGLAAVAAACTAEEDNKDSFMRQGCGELALGILQQPAAAAATVEAACSCLLSFTTADDMRPPTSKAFQHARMLAQKGASKALVPLLARFSSEPNSLLVIVLATVRQLSANEEICKEVLQEGGVSTCLQVLRTRREEPAVASVCCSTLRQLANSDAVKLYIAENQGLEALLGVLAGHNRDADILEKALGALAALMLRQPHIAAQAFQLGIGDAILEVMSENEGQAGVQRQGCISFRNLVSRNMDFRQPLLDKGVEAILRQAKKMHPSSCKDVASAALRDLGLDNYNE